MKRLLKDKHETHIPKHTVSREVRYVTLPFYGHTSYSLRNYLGKLFTRAFPQCKFRFIFTNSNTISRFFTSKDRIPNLMCSNIVYKFNCSSCNAGYIGSTFRNLKTRIFEHKGRSFRTGRVISNPSFSEIRQHSLDADHILHDTDFNIIYRARDRNELRIAESLFIHTQSPSLNKYTNSVKLHVLGN